MSVGMGCECVSMRMSKMGKTLLMIFIIIDRYKEDNMISHLSSLKRYLMGLGVEEFKGM